MTNRIVAQILTIIMAFGVLSACKQSDQSSNTNDNGVASERPVETTKPPSSPFEPVQINAAPQNLVGFPGQTASFSVSASSKIALKYQWYHNDVAINGANGSTLTITIQNEDDAGTYRVDVSNASTTESAAAELSVDGLPTISREPVTTAAYPGDSATFSVTASGADIQYEWQKKTNGVWGVIEGASNRTLLITNVDVSKATHYRVRVFNTGGRAYSEVAALTLKSPVVITQNPSARQMVAGQSATFSASASGHGTLQYRWYKDSYAIYDSSKYSGTATTTLTINSVSNADASLYRLKAFNSDNKYAFSLPGALSVAGPAKVTVQPEDITLYTGKSGSLVIAASGDQPMRYQWQRWNGSSWSAVNGARSAALNFASAATSLTGRYRCVIANDVSSAISAEANVTVLQSASISASPTSQSVASGARVSFTVRAAGDNLQYTWLKNGVALTNNINTLSFASAKEVDEATYSCRVSNGGGTVNCTNFKLTVNNPLTITQQPVNQNSYEGGSATFTVRATGEPAPTVQWHFNGTVVGTGNTLSLSNIQVSQAGQYSCVVSNSQDSLNCNTATLNISQSVKILGQPAATTIIEGAALALTMTANGEDLSYDWSRNGVSLGVNSPTLSINSIKVDQEGVYSCRIWNSNSSASCNAFAVTVNQGVRIATQPAAASAFEDASVTLTVAATGKPAPAVDWYRGSTLVRSNNASLTLSPLRMADAGSYRCVVRNSVNSINCNSVNVTVRERVRITKQLANQTLNVGDTLRLDLIATGEAPLNYQCYRNGAAIVSGTSISSLIVPSVTASHTGNYYCVVSNAGSRATSSNSAIAVVESVSTQSALLTWTAPTTRANGDRLTGSEIAGYEIYMGTSSNGPFNSVATTEHNETRTTVNDLTPGNYYFGITTLDTNGLESEMSRVFSLRIQ